MSATAPHSPLQLDTCNAFHRPSQDVLPPICLLLRIGENRFIEPLRWRVSDVQRAEQTVILDKCIDNKYWGVRVSSFKGLLLLPQGQAGHRLL